jgi:hypothetical protein
MLATVDAVCFTNLSTVVCKMPVHLSQQLPDGDLVPLALLAGELQQNIPSRAWEFSLSRALEKRSILWYTCSSREDFPLILMMFSQFQK